MSFSLPASTELNFRRFLSGESKYYGASADGDPCFISNISESERSKGKGIRTRKVEESRQGIRDRVEERDEEEGAGGGVKCNWC